MRSHTRSVTERGSKGHKTVTGKPKAAGRKTSSFHCTAKFGGCLLCSRASYVRLTALEQKSRAVLAPAPMRILSRRLLLQIFRLYRCFGRLHWASNVDVGKVGSHNFVTLAKRRSVRLRFCGNAFACGVASAVSSVRASIYHFIFHLSLILLREPQQQWSLKRFAPAGA